MTAKERILALRLLKSSGKQPEYAAKIGISVSIQKKGV